MPTSPSHLEPPGYTIPPSLKPFAVPISTYLASATPPLDGIVVSALIFRADTATATATAEDRVLVVQRAATDCLPHLWEAPGGSAEPDRDASPLGALAREVREETGLSVTKVAALVEAGTEWTIRGTRWRKVSCEVEVVGLGEAGDGSRSGVVLDPEEHQDYAWVTEEEFRKGMCADGRELRMTFPTETELILKGFTMRKGREHKE